MSRKRYISTDISLSGKMEELARRCGEYAVILFTWMIPHADDWGRMEGNADKVFFTVTPRFALLGRTPEDAEQALTVMDELGLLQRYQVKGDWYIQLNTDTFYELQTYIPQAKRQEDRSAYPAPPKLEEDVPEKHDGATHNSNQRDALAQSSGDSRKVAQSSADSRRVAQNVPSPSPSPSPSLTPKTDRHSDTDSPREKDGDSEEAEEAAPVCQSVGLDDNGDDFALICRAWDKHIGLMGPGQYDELLWWMNEPEINMPAELIAKAIEVAAQSGHRRLEYISGILRNWHNDGIKTISDLERKEKERETKRSRASPKKPNDGPKPEYMRIQYV